MQRLPTWDEYYLEIAKAVAARSDCRLSSAGAIIVAADRRLVAAGFQQSTGGESCLGGLTCQNGCLAQHAEHVALTNAYSRCLDGGTLYATHRPCHACTVQIDRTGLHTVVWPDGRYPTRTYLVTASARTTVRDWNTLDLNG